MSDVIKIIKSTSLFQNLLDKEIEDIVLDCSVLRFKQNDKILVKDNKSKNLLIVIDGEVSLKRGDGTSVQLKAGSLFGELLLLQEDKIAADVIAHTDTVDVLEIPYKNIQKYYSNNLRTYAILMENLAKMLAKRLKKAGKK